MAGYTVRLYRGDYAARIASSNFDRAVLHIEHHFGYSGGVDINHAAATRALNAPSPAEEFGQWYTAQVSAALAIPDHGVTAVVPGQGHEHLRNADMPALVLEPCFISNPAGAQLAATRLDDLATILAESIRKFFPHGGLVAFSVGHKYRSSQPHDRGGNTPEGATEADLAEQVLLKARDLLESYTVADAQEERLPTLLQSAIARAAQREEPVRDTARVDEAERIRQWVMARGIADGTRPKDPVTREEMWEMLYRALQTPR